jgi:hypothetical protein
MRNSPNPTARNQTNQFFTWAKDETNMSPKRIKRWQISI